ncbi:MAG: threonine--tRNA ligase [Candidatus Sumerlaeia bacterium]|nr:threonine--tRNA ligase [Candidatus Sumerlaeia bacterium]
MPRVKLPDGSVMELPGKATVKDLAEEIGPGLAKSALAGVVNGKAVDLAHPLSDGDEVRILTWKDPEGQEVYRHSTAHLMAQAVKRLWPQAQLTIGPPIEDGFYYDIDLAQPITPEDLPRIEAEMEKIAREDLGISREVWDRAKAAEHFRSVGESYKVELINDLPPDEQLTCYRQGEFLDLCRGPHVPSTGAIRAFKLTSVAGAYWRGDSTRQMLQRLYGTSFPDAKQLREHLRLLEEAKKRDHRKLGRELDLFSFQEEGPGFPFFHPKGLAVINEMLAYMRERYREFGYIEIKTPLILDESLWHRSGHWDNYRDNMYFTKVDEQTMAVKPMNCPGCCLWFRQGLHSYRDLPLRAAEFGQCHRHELSGALHGLFRVRTFTQDDAHIFCTPDQIEDEIVRFLEMIDAVYADFGFRDYHVELSTKPEKHIGSAEMWGRAEAALAAALERAGRPHRLNPGDGAFYGPKIDFHVKDCLKRTWQCGTVQLDFSMPERFELEYVGSDGQRHRPVMLHRAIFGSIERFFGILVENTGGDFPLWLAPEQVRVLPITDTVHGYARQVEARLRSAGLRAACDVSGETIKKKIRAAELLKIPLMLVVGAKEAETGQVAVRRHGQGDQGAVTLDEFIAEAQDEIRVRAAAPERANTES